MTYREQLVDPRWQMRRLEILKRDNATCRLCADTETELHVHHKRYANGRKAWEARDEDLETLCAYCHRFIGKIKTTYPEYEILSATAGQPSKERIDKTYLFAIYNSLTNEYMAWIVNINKHSLCQNFASTIKVSTLEMLLTTIQVRKKNG